MSLLTWIAVATLGGSGALARFVLDGAIGSRFSGDFPLGTFAVNISGALLLGLLSGLGLSSNGLLLAGTATLGSYTTFSTWMLESHRLAEDADLHGAALNLFASLAVGVAAAALGHAIGAQL
jgi:fluoride exporter